MIDFVQAGIEQGDGGESVHGAVDDGLDAGYNGIHFLGEMPAA